MRRDDWLLAQLPVGMTEHDFLRRFLQIFQDIGTTVLHQIDTLGSTFDPAVAPDVIVRQMGRWVGVDWIDSEQDDELQRRAVMEYSKMLPWRGTSHGMHMLLSLLSGDDEVTIDDSGGIFHEGESPREAPHVRLAVNQISFFRGDDDAAARQAHIDDLIKIIRTELPATVTFELEVGGRQVWPPQGSPGGEQRIAQEVS